MTGLENYLKYLLQAKTINLVAKRWWESSNREIRLRHTGFLVNLSILREEQPGTVASPVGCGRRLTALHLKCSFSDNEKKQQQKTELESCQAIRSFHS